MAVRVKQECQLPKHQPRWGNMYYRWEHVKKRRYYEVHLHKDLFNQWCLLCVWGNIGGSKGRVMRHPCLHIIDGMAHIEKIKRRRHQRHYQLVENDDETVI